MQQLPLNFSVLHVSTGKDFRGGERQVLFLHNGLRERGVASTLACRKSGRLAAMKPDCCIPFPWNGPLDLSGIFSLTAMCKKTNPALLHCHDSHALTLGVAASRLCGIPVVYTRRVAFPMGTSFFSRLKYSSCSAIIAVSAFVADQCRAVARPNTVQIVGDGVAWQAPLLSRMEARKRLNIPDNFFAIGTVAHFTAEKDIALLFYSADMIQARNPEARFVCIGPINENCKKKSSLPASLVCTGRLDNAVQYYSAFDAYVSTSLREGLGSALLDAVVRDIPCVAVNAGGTADLFPENWPLCKRGDYAGFTAAVTDLMNNYPAALAAARECGKRARDIFSVDATVEKTVEAYAKVMSA
jgi:L-malate glycosyltransferase